jgi:ubiquinone/menaquinone biosynthesis C-methylase UbiE
MGRGYTVMRLGRSSRFVRPIDTGPVTPCPKDRFRWYRRLSPWITPGARHASEAYADRLDALVRPGVRWLDLGCGSTPLRGTINPDLLDALARRPALSVGIDVQDRTLRLNRTMHRCLMADGCRLPFADASFDLLTANMVLEHIADPAALLGEARRVLTAKGVLLAHTTNAAAPLIAIAERMPHAVVARLTHLIEGRRPIDVFPAHYRCNTLGDVSRLAAAAGFPGARVTPLEDLPATKAWGPLVAAELAWQRLARHPRLRHRQDNLLIELDAPDASPTLTTTPTPPLTTPATTPAATPPLARAA